MFNTDPITATKGPDEQFGVLGGISDIICATNVSSHPRVTQVWAYKTFRFTGLRYPSLNNRYHRLLSSDGTASLRFVVNETDLGFYTCILESIGTLHYPVVRRSVLSRVTFHFQFFHSKLVIFY